jgi:hypothetical protein
MITILAVDEVLPVIVENALNHQLTVGPDCIRWKIQYKRKMLHHHDDFIACNQVTLYESLSDNLALS